MKFISNSVEETIAFGEKIGQLLKGGEVIGLVGELGSGKTHLIKGVAMGAGGADCEQVNSPTFVIVNEYHGRLSLYHIDCYRLGSVGEFDMLGFDDFCDPGSVVLIEWVDIVEHGLGGVEMIKIELSHAGDNRREIVISEAPEHLKSLL